jgi:hypothetical protein
VTADAGSSGGSLVRFGWGRKIIVGAVLAHALACGFFLSATADFEGCDEGLVLSLRSQGIVSSPCANRPLALVWALPGVLGLPSTLAGDLAVHLGHAVEYFYERRVLGVVPAGQGFLYPTRLEGDAVVIEPFPAVRGSWREPVTRHRAEEIVVLRDSGGRLTVVEEWPFGDPSGDGAAIGCSPRPRLEPGSPTARSWMLEDRQ